MGGVNAKLLGCDTDGVGGLYEVQADVAGLYYAELQKPNELSLHFCSATSEHLRVALWA